MRTLDEIIQDLPEARRAAVIKGGRELVAKEHGLRQMREARGLTQAAIAGSLRSDQATVSKIEKRRDMLVSTMRKYVEAAGGKVRIVAEFENMTMELAKVGVTAIDGSAVAKRRPVRDNALQKNAALAPAGAAKRKTIETDASRAKQKRAP